MAQTELLPDAEERLERLQAGTKEREGGRFKKNAFNNLEIYKEDVTVVPSGKPLWEEAIADLYPRMVENATFLSNKETKKSATQPKEAELGSVDDLEHQSTNPAKRES